MSGLIPNRKYFRSLYFIDCTMQSIEKINIIGPIIIWKNKVNGIKIGQKIAHKPQIRYLRSLGSADLFIQKPPSIILINNKTLTSIILMLWRIKGKLFAIRSDMATPFAIYAISQ